MYCPTSGKYEEHRVSLVVEYLAIRGSREEYPFPIFRAQRMDRAALGGHGSIMNLV